MEVPPPIHPWDVSTKRAIAIQKELADRVQRRSSGRRIRHVAGADMAFTPDKEHCVSGVVLWDAAGRCVIEQHTARRPVRFPYVPGLLSFREAPAVLAAIRKLSITPDAFIFDGQGLAHPRRFGLACHVGLLINMPSVGCAKSRLVGTHEEPGWSKGSVTPLLDGEEQIGAVVRTRDGVRPVYVSVGHRMDLHAATDLVLSCCTRYRLPEPTRLADQLVSRARAE